MLNKYLQMAQICYYATNNEELFPVEFVQGWKSGPMIIPLYRAIKADSNFLANIINVKSNLEENIKVFIDKFYGIYKEYDLDDLIEFTQWDPAWQQIDGKKWYQKKNANRLNIKKYTAVYKTVLKKQIEYFAS